MLNGKKLEIRVGGDFSPIPADLYQVQVVDVDTVTQMNTFKGKEEELLNYKMAILDDDKTDSEGQSLKGRFLWKRMSPSFSDRSWLLKFAKAIAGRELTQDELKSYDLESPVGKQVKVMVEEKPSKDGTAIYSNITSFVAVKKQMEGVEYTPKATEIVKSSSPINAPVATEDELKELGL